MMLCIGGPAVLSPRRAALLLLAGLSLAACACGRPSAPAGRLSPEAELAAAPLLRSALPAQPEAVGLPDFAALGDPPRGASLAAPGWYVTSVLHPLAQAGASFSASSVTLDSNAINGLAYLVYGVAGFEPDSGPTGARFSVSGVSGQYWIGFSDYVAGRWVFSGPFSATAEGEIPNVTPYTDPQACVSPRGVHYFCLLAPLGTALTVEKAELGVNGGAGAPRPPGVLGADAGPNGTMVGVQLSPDHLDPDFAGYLFQRAPLLSGDYSDMFGGPTREPVKFDFTATNADGYRWRVCSVDTSGNSSIWVTSAARDIGPGNMPPVAHATFPQGRLFGPLSVTFDLSTSLDPDGDTITEYGIFVEPGGPTFSATPEITLTLQPGCYNIIALAKDASTFNFTPYRLKVYPQWEPASTVVAAAQTSQPGFATSLIRPRISRSPDGRFALCGQGDGFDFDVHYETEPGVLQQWSTPLYVLTSFVGEPLWHNAALMCPFGTSEGIFCAVFDPAADGGAGRLRQLDLLNDANVLTQDPPAAPYVAICEDQSGQVWAFYQADNLGSLDFTVRNVSTMAEPLILLAGITAIKGVDCELRSDGLIEVALATGVATEEFEFDPATQILTPLSVIAPAPLDALDLELDPATDLPAVAYYVPFPTERVRYTEKDGGAVWSPALNVENAAANGIGFDFYFEGSTALLGLTYGGQAALYEVEAMSSSQRNLPAGLSSDPEFLSCCPLPAAATALLTVDPLTGLLKVTRLDADGTDSPLLSLDSTSRQGFNLQAAAEGAANLHTTWANINAGALKHAVSSDGGASWSLKPDLPFSLTAALGANKAGNLALSWTGGGMHMLYTWDAIGESWIDEGVGENGAFDSRPCLSNDPYSDEIVWLHYNDVTTKLRATNGLPGAFTSLDVPSDLPNLWMGAVIPSGGTGVYWGYLDAGGLLGPSGGYVHWSEDGTNDWLFPPNGNDPYCELTQVATYGRTFAGSRYAAAPALFSLPTTHVFYTVTGDTLMPQRYVYPDQDGQHVSVIEALPASRSDIFSRELRRSVSAYPAWGRTAVCVISGYDGVEQYMEWSNFGEFEALPMPDIGRANYTCIVVGQDGRWHLIYHDVQSDAILCRSTL